MSKIPFCKNQRNILITVILISLIGFILTLFLLVQKLQSIELAKKQSEDTLSLIEKTNNVTDIDSNDLSDDNLSITTSNTTNKVNAASSNLSPDQLSDEVLIDIDKNIQSINSSADFVESDLDFANLSK